MDKRSIIEEMKVAPEIDPKIEINSRVSFIQNQLEQAESKTLVLGISRGVDSFTCGRLAQLAIDGLNDKYNSEDYKFIAVRPTVLKRMKTPHNALWTILNLLLR